MYLGQRLTKVMTRMPPRMVTKMPPGMVTRMPPKVVNRMSPRMMTRKPPRMPIWHNQCENLCGMVMCLPIWVLSVHAMSLEWVLFRSRIFNNFLNL